MDQLRGLRRHAPVSVCVLDHYPVLHSRPGYMVHPFLHRPVMPDDRDRVAETPVKHPGHIEIRARPCDVILIKHPEVRRHIRDGALFILRVGDVLQPFLVQEIIVEHIALPVRTRGTVPEPAEPLVPLRAVGRHTVIIAPYSPRGVAVYPVDRGI